jgi:hypothetical protein
MEHLNQWVEAIRHNYILIIVAAVLFFGVKSLTGYLTFRKVMRELHEIKQLIKNQR